MSETFIKYVVLYFCSMLPWIEQKAGIVMILDGQNFWLVYLTISLAAMTIVPITIIFTNTIIKLLKKIGKISRQIEKFENGILAHKDKMKKYEVLGLFIIVVFPGTGMWTASMLASILKVDLKKAVFWIVLGSMVVSLGYLGTTVGVYELWNMRVWSELWK